MADEVSTIVKRGSGKTAIVLVVMLIVVARVFFLGSVEERMIGSKCIAALLFVVLGLLSLVVLSNARQWREELAIAEKQMEILRDEVLVAGMVARAQMAEASERMRRDPEKEQSEIMAGLMKQAMPLITMVMKKERSALTWGLAGFKLIRSLVSYFASKK